MAASRRVACIVGLCAFVYFVFYPGDLAVLGEPVTQLVRVIAEPLNMLFDLSTAVSPWLYGVIIAAILGRTVTGVWGKPPKAATKRKAGSKVS